jgi:hypothetical protein
MFWVHATVKWFNTFPRSAVYHDGFSALFAVINAQCTVGSLNDHWVHTVIVADVVLTLMCLDDCGIVSVRQSVTWHERRLWMQFNPRAIRTPAIEYAIIAAVKRELCSSSGDIAWELGRLNLRIIDVLTCICLSAYFSCDLGKVAYLV